MMAVWNALTSARVISPMIMSPRQTSRTLVSIGYVLVAVAFAVFVAGGVYSWRAKRRLDGLKDGAS